MQSLFSRSSAFGHGQSLLSRYAADLARHSVRQKADLSQLQGLEIKRLDLLMRRIVESNFDAILTVDPDGRIMMANAAAGRMFGYHVGSLQGAHIEGLIPHFDRFSAEGHADYCVGHGYRETHALCCDGGELPVELSLTETDFGNEKLFVTIIRDITQVKEQRRQLEYQALHDALTGLPNRALLNDRMRHAMLAARRSGDAMSLLLIDLDNFKQINDTLGHHIGDMLLIEIAQRLLEPVRDCDTVARLGGDEFAILLPSAGNQARAEDIARRLRQSIIQPVSVLDGLRLEVGASIGIAMYPKHADDPAKLLQCADVAMYGAKDGANKIVAYDPEKDSSDVRQLTLSGELREAIEGAQMALEYQPKLDLGSRSITGVEALARWQHPRLGLVPPGEFVAHAERTGMIQQLTAWVLETVMSQFQAWNNAGSHFGISINISPRSLHDSGLPDILGAIMRNYAVRPEQLTLEITETAIVLDPDNAFGNLRQIADLGVRLSIDDFGTGYSSLSYLQKLPISELKIDRSFVAQMHENDNDIVIVRSIIDLAHNLGLKVVAEGIENAQHLELLGKMNCDMGQGYHVSPSMSGEDFCAWLPRCAWHDKTGINDRAAPSLAPVPPMQRRRIAEALGNPRDGQQD